MARGEARRLVPLFHLGRRDHQRRVGHGLVVDDPLRLDRIGLGVVDDRHRHPDLKLLLPGRRQLVLDLGLDLLDLLVDGLQLDDLRRRGRRLELGAQQHRGERHVQADDHDEADRMAVGAMLRQGEVHAESSRRVQGDAGRSTSWSPPSALPAPRFPRFVPVKRAVCRKGVKWVKSFFARNPRESRDVPSRLMRATTIRSMRARHFFHTFANSQEALDNG